MSHPWKRKRDAFTRLGTCFWLSGNSGVYNAILSCDPPMSEPAPWAATWLMSLIDGQGEQKGQAKRAMCSDDDLRILPWTFSFYSLFFYFLWPPKSQRHLPHIPQVSWEAMHRAGQKCSSTTINFPVSPASSVSFLSSFQKAELVSHPSLAALGSAWRDVLPAVDLQLVFVLWNSNWMGRVMNGRRESFYQ